MSQQHNVEMCCRRISAMSFGVSLGTYERRFSDVLLGCPKYVLLRHLGDLLLRHRWVFCLRLV